MQYAVLFPGQGSQFVGMGTELFAARPDLLGSAADEVLGWSLQAVCATGPEDELVRTERAQPALYSVSYALWEAFAVRVPHLPMAAAGHSLGEYTALAASGALDYRDGLQLVAQRGAAMAEATQETAGKMAAVMGADLDTIERVVAVMRNDGHEIWVANINAPGQTVVAGAAESIDTLAADARGLGLRRVIPVKVAGAFHTPLMAPAQARLSAALSSVEFWPGSFPVWANLEAAPAEDVAAALSGQLVGKVRFSESLVAMREAGAEAFVHIGPGEVTAGMAKRTVEDAKVITVSELSDIAAAVDALTVV
jgi:[acyl-carrier-protein] S-malonyltransferase